jgi:integrase
LALEAFRGQLRLSPCNPYLFPSDENPSGHQRTLKTSWHATLWPAKVAYFRIYDLRSTYATRLSDGGVADEWVTQMLRQGDALVFKKYSRRKSAQDCSQEPYFPKGAFSDDSRSDQLKRSGILYRKNADLPPP